MPDPQAPIEKVLETARIKFNSEVSGLLGAKLNSVKAAHRFVTRADLCQLQGKFVLVTLKVEGELEGAIFLMVSIRDAILLGGTLIMLPSAELESRVKGEEFVGDEADAFGEVANIIAGLYSSTFEESYPRKVHLVKSDLKVVVPAAIDAAAVEPFPEERYFMASSLVNMAGKQLDEFRLLFPAELFGLGTAAEKPAQPATGDGPAAAHDAVPGAAAPQPESLAAAEEGNQILVIAENAAEGRIVAEAVQQCGYHATLLGFSDKIKDAAAAGAVAGVFLVMTEVSEKGMAAIIKAKSACGNSSPLIAAGPQWTRKTVLQAVKYGACDIVVTPVVPEEVRQKVEVHLR